MAKQFPFWKAWLTSPKLWGFIAIAIAIGLWHVFGSRIKHHATTSTPVPQKTTSVRKKALALNQATAETRQLFASVDATPHDPQPSPEGSASSRPVTPKRSSLSLADIEKKFPPASRDGLTQSLQPSRSAVQSDELTRSITAPRSSLFPADPFPIPANPAPTAQRSKAYRPPSTNNDPPIANIPFSTQPQLPAEIAPSNSQPVVNNKYGSDRDRNAQPPTPVTPHAQPTESLRADKDLTELQSPTASDPVEPDSSPAAPAMEIVPAPAMTEFAASDSPLISRHPMMPTAQHLRGGEVTFNVRNRLFFLPGSVEESGTGANPNIGFTWGVTDTLELTLEAQRVDPGSPQRQGSFLANRNPDRDDFENKLFFEFQELALDIKQQIWQNDSQTQALSGVLSLAWGSRPFSFRQEDGRLVEDGEQQGITPALQFPFTTTVNDKFRFTISPTVAFFNQRNALHLHQSPIDDPGSFGTTFGLGGALSYNITPDLILWGDAFFPITGNNSVSRSSGKTAKTIAYNAGLRYLVNPRVALDLFASNTLGSTGPLALTADRGRTALGVGVSFMPDFIPGNRRYPNQFGAQSNQTPTPKTVDGLAFFDGGTIPGGRAHLDVQGGSQGVLAALRYGLVEDLEVGVYLDYVSGQVDESEQGFSGKVRLLNQAAGDPLTLSLATTLGLTNENFVNFVSNKRDEFKRLDLDKRVPFILQGDDGTRGQLFVATVSLPLQYQFDSGAAVWFTPTWGFVQRNGTEIAGFNLGGSVPVARDVSILGEIGANFASEGNAFFGDTRANAIPWSVGLRWDPTILLGIDPQDVQSAPYLQLYLTNRVGASPFHDLRVRADNDLAVGVGFSIPF